MNLIEATDNYRLLLEWAEAVTVRAFEIERAHPGYWKRTDPKRRAVAQLLGDLTMARRMHMVPLVWISADVLKIVLHAADLLPAELFDFRVDKEEIDNPWTGKKTDVRAYAHPADSRIPDFNVIYFETPVNFGNPDLDLWGVASLPTTIEAATYKPILLPLGLYSRRDIVRLEPESSSTLPNLDPVPALIDESERDRGWRFDYAIHQFSSQKLLDTEIRRPPRPALRRWERESNLEIPEEMVIHLRRIDHTGKRDGDPGEVEWSHRWWVDGHWRNQWYPSTQDHRPVWIDGYVKGPEDKPLVLKERRIAVDR